MAYIIPSDFFMPAGRLLVLPDEGEGACIGTIVRIATDENWGCFRSAFRFSIPDYTKLTRTVQDPDYVTPPPPEPHGEPDKITTEYAKVIFNREIAQDVKVDDVDYVLIHVDDILGLIPPE